LADRVQTLRGVIKRFSIFFYPKTDFIKFKY
jgi:hypothetical protein